MPGDRRAERLALRREKRARGEVVKEPLSVQRIVDTALELIAADGFEALTMRRLALALKTGPASLYAHVLNKADLDDLLIGFLCTGIVLPEADSDKWREQIFDVLAQIRDQYLKYPGISAAALAVVPTNLETLRISEGMLSILLAGGVVPQTAAWAVDSLTLYVNAYCLELSMWSRQMDPAKGEWVDMQDTLQERFAALPEDEFPNTKRYAAQLIAGEGHDRFDFALTTMIDGLGGR